MNSCPNPPQRAALLAQLADHERNCSECQICVAECRFLTQRGNPRQIAQAYDPSAAVSLRLPFECSLCGLCKAVCPEGLDPGALFLEMRREAVERGLGSFPGHRGLLAYERKGTSKRYSWYALPAGCRTIFFPGCALTGTRPERTLEVFAHLRKTLPALGIVLDCCTKPSHDLGRDAYFQAMFGEMKRFLLDQQIRSVLVACPNCYQVFRSYAPEFDTRTIYETLNAEALPATATVAGAATVHDPCVSRFAAPVQEAVRGLLTKKGLAIQESRHSRQTTLCCGEGGAVGGYAPELAAEWARRQVRETPAERILTYCAGCAKTLGAHMPTQHVLDLLFTPEAAMANRAQVAKAPITYLNRLKVKRWLRKRVVAAVTRERTSAGGEISRSVWLKNRFALLGLLAAVVLLLLLVAYF